MHHSAKQTVKFLTSLHGVCSFKPRNQAEVLTQFNISPGTSHWGTAPEVQAAGEQREPLGFRHCRAQRNVLLQTGKSS